MNPGDGRVNTDGSPHDRPVPDGWAEPDGSTPGPGSERPGGEPYAPAPGDGSPGGEPGAYWPPPGVAPPYGPAGQPKAPRPRKRHARLIVAVCAVLAVALLTVQTVMELREAKRRFEAARQRLTVPTSVASPVPTPPPTSPAAVPHSLTIPRSFDGYVRMTGNMVDEFASRVRRAAKREDPEIGRMFARARFAAYRKRATVTPRLFFIGFSAAADPGLAEDLRSTPPSEEADSLLPGSANHGKDYPAGPFGGVLRCARDKLEGQRTAACIWVDQSMIGWVMDRTTADPKTLARDALTLRGAAEH
jgi:hypothetical protein